MNKIKSLFHILIILCLICVLQFDKSEAAPAGSVLWEAIEAGHALEISLVEMLHVRYHAMRVFLRKHLGNEFVEKNQHSFTTWCDEPVVSVRLTELLKSLYPEKKERNRIIADFRYPSPPSNELKRFQNSLNRLLHVLRVPLPHGGYKYLTYSKSYGGKAGTQKLVARHTKDKPQQWQQTFEGKIYRIHMYSPSKRGVFGGNRDVWLDSLLVDFHVENKKQTRSYPLKRVLKRGESIDIDLPEIADKVNATLYFACKAEHRGKAEFFVEFMLAAKQDMIDAPDAALIAMIKSFTFSKTVRKTREELAVILNKLGSRMTGTVRESKNSKNEINTGKKDQLQYFLYMLKDQSVKREDLINRFSNMFGL